jgi:hypothetical protein
MAMGQPLCGGEIMVSVVGKGEAFVPELLCAVCGAKCCGDRFRFAFPHVQPGERVNGAWVCGACASGRLNRQLKAMFGTQRVLFMTGVEALRRLAQSLHDAAENQALARQRPRARAKVTR